jgi:hypothetical protein
MALNQIPFTAAGNLTRDPELRSVRRLQARARTIRHGRRRGGGAANGWVELLRRGRAELWAPFHRATRRLVPAVPEALALLGRTSPTRPGPRCPCSVGSTTGEWEEAERLAVERGCRSPRS